MKNYWDIISGVYDLFERLYNGKCYDGTGDRVAGYIENGSRVLECACGTGSITAHIAPKCESLRATDFSVEMLRRAAKNCRSLDNVRFCRADIFDLDCRDEYFDAVVAGNVIHLLDEPYKAIDELLRVCKKGGRVIIPTYINMAKPSNRLIVKIINSMGANFKRQFDIDSYKQFFADGGYENVTFDVVEGKMPCALAVITK